VHVSDFRVVEGASRVIYVPEDFASIQAAINNATSADTVFVHQGLYYENIVVNKAVSLLGENKNTTIIDGSGLGSVILVNGVRVKISGFTLRNSGVGWPKSGIQVVNSYLNTISDNLIQDNHIGILIDSSHANDIYRNYIIDTHYGIYILNSRENKIDDNVILSSARGGGGGGVVFSSSYGNTFEANLVKDSANVGVALISSYGNNFYFNNFVNNMHQVSVYPEDNANVWNAEYPQGGNFWSDYRGPDVYRGPYQNETGSDGIGDLPYMISYPLNKDRYPHLREVVAFHDVTVKSVTPSASRVYGGQILEIYAVVANIGNYTETFSVTVYYDTTVIETKIVKNLTVGSELSLTFAWNTTGVEANSIYTIKAEASEVPGERDKSNNILIWGDVKVRSYALLLVRLAGVTPCNQSGYPITSFKAGAIGYFRVVVNNTSPESEIVLVTVNAFDASNATLGVVSFKSTIMLGVSTFILGLPLPSTSSTGTATVFADAFTEWPYLGGLPYCPEASATFQIAGS
jgi:parallel beta-helix repeat protein